MSHHYFLPEIERIRFP